MRTKIKRLTRRTICFSNIEEIHALVVGLFIDCEEFGLEDYETSHLPSPTGRRTTG
ncbi:MAG: hypothetical protein JO235_05540 [Chroococcidiopsidaceae cyanobacterium CP_BM_RX_35]|nr:hypothetical protein [Chroococcidiopsidaceae cyanobacterium CP_BM_RX_35]